MSNALKRINRIYFTIAAVGITAAALAAVTAYAGTPLQSVQAFGVPCGTSGGSIVEIKPMMGDFSGYKTVRCSQAMSPVGVYVGGSGLQASDMMGYKLCESDECTDSAITMDVSQGKAYCIGADAATPSFLNCIAGK